MSDALSVFLTVEAVDRASHIINRIGDVMESMEGKLASASARATMSATELQVAQDKVAASATAYERALGTQAEAQLGLRLSTEALTSAQTQYQAALASATGATKAQADAVVIASQRQVVALDELRAAEVATATRSRELAAAQASASTSMVTTTGAMKAGAVAAGAMALATAAVGVHSVHAASEYQASMMRLVTSAGESRGALDKLSQDTLRVSVETATSTEQLAKGLYFVESAGYHSADAIKILTAAAEGARAEGAEMAEMTNALTTVMKDYRFTADESTKATDMMVAAVSVGKMTMQQFSSSLSTVLPTARSSHIAFEEIAGAISTLTSQGITAQQATLDLNHIIQKLQAPTAESQKYMSQLGLSAEDLAANLGKRGLTGTMEILTKAIADHTKGGKVLVDAFMKSKNAAADMNIMLENMPAPLRKISEQLEAGTMSYKEYIKAIKDMGGPGHAMGAQFASLAATADGFNQQIKTGGPAALEYTAALKKVVGDQTSLHAALALTNGGLGSFKHNVEVVGTAAKHTGEHVHGWEEIQSTFAYKTARVKEEVHALFIAIGQGLLPVVSEIADKISKVLGPIVDWASHHQKLAATIVIVTFALTALVAIVLTTILVAGSLAAAITALGLTFDVILASTGVGLILLAIGAAAVFVAMHWKETKQVLAAVWKWIEDAASAVADWFVKVWRDAVNLWDSIWSEIGGTVKKWWPLILAPVTGGLSVIVGLFIKYRKQIGDVFSAIWEGLVGAWDASGGKLVTLIAHAWDVVSESVSKEWNRISKDLAEIWGELVAIWDLTGGKLVHWISQHWDTIKTYTSAVWDQIHGQLSAVWGLIWAAVSGMMTTIVDILRLGWDIVSGVFKIAWDLIWGIVKGGAQLVWGVIKAAWDLIWASTKVAWNTIIMVFEVAWDLIKGIINTALDLIKGILRVFIDLLTGNWQKAWHDVLDTVSRLLHNIWDTVSTVFRDIWRWIQNVTNNIKDGLIGAWRGIYDGVSGFVRSLWDGIKSAFNSGLNTLGNIWNGLKRLAADPVNFVIDTVYNHGIRTLWNSVAGAFGGKQLGAIGAIHFAAGGQVPGHGYEDSVPAMLMPGEFVLSHAMIKRLGGLDAVKAAVGQGSNDGRHFKGGGLVDWATDKLSSVAGAVKDAVLGGLADVAQTAFGPINALLDHIPGGNTGFGQSISGAIRGLEGGIMDFLRRKDKEAPKGVGEPLDGWIRKAIAVTHAPMSWFKGLEIIAMHESGGNPRAANNWDINAKNGDPSRGLMQTIGATFRAYHQAGTSNDIFDPVANVAAAINYIRSRYHDINNVPGIKSMNHGGAYMGYERGTWDTGPFSQMALLHPREAVLPAGIASSLRDGKMGGNNTLVLDMRGSTISSERDLDNLISKIERRIATRILPAGGTRIRM